MSKDRLIPATPVAPLTGGGDQIASGDRVSGFVAGAIRIQIKRQK